MRYIIRRNPEQFKTGFHQERIDALRNVKNETIFVGTNCDYFAKTVPTKFIEDTISSIKQLSQTNTFMFLTKNPDRYFNFIDMMDKKWLLGCTIETNEDRTASKYSEAPYIEGRWRAMANLKHEESRRTYIMIEPILRFDFASFFNILSYCAAMYYVFGANSIREIKLEEPNIEPLKRLIDLLRRQGRKVLIKENCARLGLKPIYGKLKWSIPKFEYEQEIEQIPNITKWT